ncbi:tyrosine-type recombinase/integrase [Paraburkholderia unamae]|uniref:tyrosine-type recombinase/integrase n=1 Tax=Paraburkholderia unamae TaxID=219649 RepID=UPI001CC4442F|nr:site-specific integrase [Paraburkholderia unamae]
MWAALKPVMRVAFMALTEYKCQHAKPGRHADGGNLYLQVRGRDAKAWLYRYRDPYGKDRALGLGQYPAVNLEEARAKALELTRQRAQGVDPMDSRRAQEVANAATGGGKQTFRTVAESFIKMKTPEWSNAKHAQQWTNTLTAYAFPTIGDLPIEAITTQHVLSILQPIWTTKLETGRRLQQRIALVLGYAIAKHLRPGPNPGGWKGNLEFTLTSHKKMKAKNPEIVQHHEALPWAEMGAFMADLRTREAQSARALEFCILTCARTANVLDVEWAEIDADEAVWTIPAAKMKGRREHRVPLSRQALDVLEAQRGVDERLVFASKSKPLSNMAMLALLARMGREGLTVHGFRSSFRDWIAEATELDPVAAEIALAHAVGDATERAYQRGDLYDKRADMMQQWATYCATPPKVTKLRKRTA